MMLAVDMNYFKCYYLMVHPSFIWWHPVVCLFLLRYFCCSRSDSLECVLSLGWWRWRRQRASESGCFVVILQSSCWYSLQRLIKATESPDVLGSPLSSSLGFRGASRFPPLAYFTLLMGLYFRPKYLVYRH